MKEENAHQEKIGEGHPDGWKSMCTGPVSGENTLHLGNRKKISIHGPGGGDGGLARWGPVGQIGTFVLYFKNNEKFHLGFERVTLATT